MKKIIIFLFLILIFGLTISSYPLAAQAATAKASVKAKTVKPKTTAKAKTKYTSKYKTTMKWEASGLKYLSQGSHFDYSSAIRNAVIKKIENYAKRKKIKVVTRAVIDGMRE